VSRKVRRKPRSFKCSHKCSHGATKEKRAAASLLQPVDFIGGVDGTRTRDPRRDRPGVERASMRVSARFIFQRPRKTCNSCLGHADRIPKTDAHQDGASPWAGGATGYTSACRAIGSGGLNQPCFHAPVPTARGPAADAIDASLGTRTRTALWPLRREDSCRRASRGRRGSAVTVQLVPGRSGLVERDPIAVALCDGRRTEVQPCLRPFAFAMRFGEERTSVANTLVHRVGMYGIPLGNISDNVLIANHRIVSIQDFVHPLSTSALTRIFTWIHRNLSRFGLHDSKNWRTHRETLQATLGHATQTFNCMRLGVRWQLSLADFKVHSNPATPAMNFPMAHQTDDRIADHGESSLLLSRQEVAALTGTKQPLRQRRWFDARGWPYVEAMGRSAHPRVARSVFDDKMKGRDPSRAAPQPRFDALDRLARLS